MTERRTQPVVLLVDDNVDACQAMAWLLRAHGYAAEIAHDVRTAVAAAATHEPDALVLDLYLPDGSGMDLVAQLRNEPWAGGSALIAMTGDRDAVDEATRAGFHHVLVKPVDVAALITCLPEPTGSDR